MTVKELREALSEFPDDMLVLVDGYEDGWDDTHGPTSMTVYDVQGTSKRAWWSGRYDDAQDEGEPSIEAVVLSR